MSTWSLSRLHTYEGCGLKYKFRYVDGMKSEAGPAAARGVLKHSIMEAALQSDAGPLPIDLSQYQAFMGSLIAAGAVAEKKMALDAAWNPVDYDAPEVRLRSVLDVLVVQAIQAILYDWKTGKIYDSHEDQKDLYSAIVLRTYPDIYQVRAVHVYIDLGKNREKTVHRDQVPAIIDRFEARVANMERPQEYIPNPTFMCRYCSFSKYNSGPCKF